MHGLQIQDAARTQALQAVRRPCLYIWVIPFVDCARYSFELGGEKKTKGAALQFVSILSYLFMPCVGADCSCSNRLCIVSLSLSRYPYHRCHYLPSAHYVVALSMHMRRRMSQNCIHMGLNGVPGLQLDDLVCCEVWDNCVSDTTLQACDCMKKRVMAER